MQFKLFGFKVSVEGVQESSHFNFVIACIGFLFREHLDAFSIKQIYHIYEWSTHHSVIIGQKVLDLPTISTCCNIARYGVSNGGKSLSLLWISNDILHVFDECVINAKLCPIARIDYVEVEGEYVAQICLCGSIFSIDLQEESVETCLNWSARKDFQIVETSSRGCLSNWCIGGPRPAHLVH